MNEIVKQVEKEREKDKEKEKREKVKLKEKLKEKVKLDFVQEKVKVKEVVRFEKERVKLEKEKVKVEKEKLKSSKKSDFRKSFVVDDSVLFVKDVDISVKFQDVFGFVSYKIIFFQFVFILFFNYIFKDNQKLLEDFMIELADQSLNKL